MKIMDIKLVIFDLDLTLIDSKGVKKYRDEKNWKQVFDRIASIAPYPGIGELLEELHGRGLRIAIVTSSPDMYCKKIIDHQGWGGVIDKRDVTGYHQTARRKPHPEPIYKILQHTKIPAEHAVHVGDEPKDTQAAQSAGVFAIGAGWDALDFPGLANSKPDIIFKSVDDLRVFLGLG